MTLVQLAERNNNAKSADLEATLVDALKDVRSGARIANRAVIIFLDDTNGKYDLGFQQCGMSMSEVVALLAIFQYNVIHNEMRTT
jgi:hypothetical protein